MKKVQKIQYALTVAAIALIYFFSARFGLSLAFTTKQVTTIWPPTGIGIAVILLMGRRFWPGIAIGAFFANIITNEPAWVALIIAVGNTLEAVVAVYLLKRFRFQNSLERIRDVIGLIVAGGFLSTAVSATIGVLSLAFAGIVAWPSYASTWFTWWIGDMMGCVIFTPIILIWFQKIFWSPFKNWRKIVEASALIASIFAVSHYIFFSNITDTTFLRPLPYMLLPLYLWGAMRFTQMGAVTVNLVVSSLAAWATLHGVGPYAGGTSTDRNLISMQVFILISSMTSLILAAATRDMKRAEEKERSLAEQKNEFISLASHQLRTPPTIINWYTEVIRSGTAGPLTEQQADYLDEIGRANQRMVEVVNSLLNITRVDLHTFAVAVRAVSIPKLINDAIAEERQHSSNPFEIVTHYDPDLRTWNGDPGLLYIVVGNLISNAVKYNVSPDAKIEITVREAEGKFVIEIKDNGAGIDADDQGKVFRKLFRTKHGISTVPDGTGLGLYMVKKILDFMGGDIYFDSKEGVGTTFFVSFPAVGMKERPGTSKLTHAGERPPKITPHGV